MIVTLYSVSSVPGSTATIAVDSTIIPRQSATTLCSIPIPFM